MRKPHWWRAAPVVASIAAVGWLVEYTARDGWSASALCAAYFESSTNGDGLYALTDAPLDEEFLLGVWCFSLRARRS
jgi:hypothetical protein